MKKLMIILLLTPIIAFSEGSSDPMDKINAFVKPLQEEGLKGLDKAMEEGQLELNKFYIEAAQKAGKEVPSTDEFRKDMHENLEKHGKLLRVNEVQVDSRLNGHQKKYTIEFEFFDGTKKKAEFQFIRPSVDGDYKLFKSNMLSY